MNISAALEDQSLKSPLVAGKERIPRVGNMIVKLLLPLLLLPLLLQQLPLLLPPPLLQLLPLLLLLNHGMWIMILSNQ